MLARTDRATSRPGNGPVEPRDAAIWLRDHGVTLAAVTLLVVQLLWTTTLLGHGYFRQDDYYNFDRSLAGGFTWGYLFKVNAGHMAPLGFAMSWLLARIALYSWLLAGAVIIAMVAAACFALLRVLRTLFGDRPAILVPLAVYLFCPLSLAAVSWWSVAVQTLPLEIALFMATDAHVRYLRGGGKRRAAAAVGWLLAGLATVQRGALIPLLLFAITSAFFAEGRWITAAVVTARRYWRLWLLYGLLLAGYCVLFFSRLPGSTSQPSVPVTAGRVASFAGTLAGTTLVPGILGGPWRWIVIGDNTAQAAPPVALQQLSWGLALLVVLVSCLYRVRAWRAWVTLLGWIAAADLVPVIIGRLSWVVPNLLGLQARYVTDALAVLALCIGLAFLPLAGADEGFRFRLPAASEADPSVRTARAVGISLRIGSAALALAFLAGSFWSLQALEGVTYTKVARSYIATAGLAVQQIPRGAMIVNGSTPGYIMAPAFFGSAASTSRVLGAMASPGKHLRWVRTPRGIAPDVRQFDQFGRLQRLILGGLPSGAPPKGHCWNVTSAGTTIPLPRSLYRWTWTARLDYSGPATRLAVRFGNSQALVALPAGTHSYYVPLTGSGKGVTVALLSPGAAACLTGVTVGIWRPAPFGQTIPALPVVG
jgi:hypothetical protein